MKKLHKMLFPGELAVVVFLGVLAGSSQVSAAPLGGLSYNIGPGLSVSAGVGFMQRDVHVIQEESIIDESNSSRFVVKINGAPTTFLDIYGLVGATDYQLDDVDYRGRLSTLYGIGIRPMLFPYSFNTPLNVSVDLQYLAFTTKDHDIEARYQEFQGALILSYRLTGVAPYGGLKYNPVLVGVTGRHNDLEGEMDAGVFIGCDYFVTPNVFFTGELSIFSETSIHLMVGYSYPSNL